MSNRLAPVHIISIAQHANPKVTGQMLHRRAQLMAQSTEVIIRPGSNRFSIRPIALVHIRLLREATR